MSNIARGSYRYYSSVQKSQVTTGLVVLAGLCTANSGHMYTKPTNKIQGFQNKMASAVNELVCL